MLIEFTIGNYRSFRDPVTLTLEAAPLKAEDREVDAQNLFEKGGVQLLKVAGLYGANASGKSNLIRALHTMVFLVRNSSREGQAGDRLPADVFRLSSEPLVSPSFFEVVLADDRDQFRYGFEITRQQVEKEWLYRRPFDKSREHRLFERRGDSYKSHKDFGEGRDLRQKTRDNALHLSVCAQFDGSIATQVMSCIDDLYVVNGLEATGLLLHAVALLEEDASRAAVLELVQRFDVGISDLEVTKRRFTEDELKPVEAPEIRRILLEDGISTLKAVHVVLDDQGEAKEKVSFRVDEESDGTQKLLALSGVLLDALRHGSTLVIDEFDARLHPFISREIVRLFQSRTTNPKNAQLIFTTHDTNLLQRSLFRRDQLWFLEKHPQTASSELYSLAEIRMESGTGVRNDARFERDYLQGRYGAVPFLGNFQEIIGDVLETLSETDRGPE